METKESFLRGQLANAVALHRALLEDLEHQAADADDPRYRDLCSRHVPIAREHQRTLLVVLQEVGVADSRPTSGIAATLGIRRGLADIARDSDYVRLVGDIAIARQCEDLCATFREAGRILGNQPLQQIGEIGKRHHEAFVHDANRLAQWMFIEQVQGIGVSEPAGRFEGDSPAS